MATYTKNITLITLAIALIGSGFWFYTRDNAKETSLSVIDLPKTSNATLDKVGNQEAVLEQGAAKASSSNQREPVIKEETSKEQLDKVIDKNNEKMTGLVKEYNQDLSNTKNKEKLSNELKNNAEYRQAILEKFKRENAEAVEK